MSSHVTRQASRHIGNPTPPAYPYPVLSAHALSSSSVYVQGGVHWFSMTPLTRVTRSMTKKARMVEGSEGSLLLHIASPNEFLEPPLRGKKRRRKKQSRRTTIEMLPENTLLEIFDFYRLDAMESSFQRPWRWHHLAHVCRKWRHIISMSPRRLELRILCEYGTPIENILCSWTTLPLVVRCKDLRSKSLPNNVIVALRRPYRVCEIDLVLPSSLIGSIIEVIQEPLQALECIRITVENATGPPVLVREAFLGGSAQGLREINLNGITFPFPAIRQVLLSTNHLIELHLDNIPNDAYFSPDDLVTGLSTLVQLKRLRVGFHSPASPSPSTRLPPPQRITLPSLTSFSFHGATEYLEEFVDRIDLPTLHTITIRFFNQIFFEIPQFCQFIRRPNALRSPTRVVIRHSVRSVSVSFREREREPGVEDCLFVTSCRRLDWQLSFATQISNQLCPLFSIVRELTIDKGPELPTGEEDVASNQWLELLQPFTHVTWLGVPDMELVPGVTQALVAEGMTTEVLPELTSLGLSGGRGIPSVETAAKQFIATRKLSGRMVSLN